MQRTSHLKIVSLYSSTLSLLPRPYPNKGLVHTVFWHALICHRNASSPIDQSLTFHGKVLKSSACVDSVYQAPSSEGAGFEAIVHYILAASDLVQVLG